MGSGFYPLIIRGVQFAHRGLGVEVWARNSVRLGHARAPRSDVDLSFYVARDQGGTHEAAKRRYRLLRRLCPWIGEASFYDDRRLAFILKHQNILELARDPELLDRFPGARDREASLEAKFTFLARMIEADRTNLRRRPRARAEKWRAHLRACGIERFPRDDFNANTLLNILEEDLFKPLFRVPMRSLIRDFLQGRASLAGESEMALLLFAPHRWIYSMRRSESDIDRAALTTLTAREKEVLAEQLRWEFCYLLVSETRHGHDANWIRHASFAFRLLKDVDPEKAPAFLAEFCETAGVGLDAIAPAVSPTYCVRPWHRFLVDTDGRYSPCESVEFDVPALNLNRAGPAEILKSPELAAIKKAMTEGKKVDQCAACYRNEASGIPSLREIANRELPLTTPLLSLELHLGNSCSQKCVTCTAHNSSAWYSQMRDAGAEKSLKPAGTYLWHVTPGFQRGFREILPLLGHLSLDGGEPLEAESHSGILESCLSSGRADRIALSYQTNGLVDPRRFFPLWKRFKSVSVNVKIEGIGKHHDYLRYPSRWEQVLETLHRLEAAPVRVRTRIALRVHALNFYYLPEILNWSDRKRIVGPVTLLKLDHPECFRLEACPPRLKDAIRARFEDTGMDRRLSGGTLRSLLRVMDSTDAYDASAVAALRNLDRIRALAFSETFPEIASYYEQPSSRAALE